MSNPSAYNANTDSWPLSSTGLKLQQNIRKLKEAVPTLPVLQNRLIHYVRIVDFRNYWLANRSSQYDKTV